MRRSLRSMTLTTVALTMLVPLGGASAGSITHLDPSPRLTRSAAMTGSVLAISVDGLNPQAIRRLGAHGTPNLHRLMRGGASTLNARTEYERTETLPNHTGMVTGRRIRASAGGHGVTWNDDRRSPATVQAAAGHPVSSVFEQVHRLGGSSALFASKTKFSLWKRSWPAALDRTVIRPNNKRLVKALRADYTTPRAFRFLHLSAPDVVGHAKGYMGRAYLRQVRATDAQLGKVLATVQRRSPGTIVVLTSDHGGLGHSHKIADKRVNYTVPFMVWGPGITKANLYRINPGYRAPGKKRVGYRAARQPVRNGDLANLSLYLLGLAPVPGSELNVDQDLRPVSGLSNDFVLPPILASTR